MAKAVLTPQSEDFPKWYQDLVAKAELAENGPVRGTMVIRPYGYAIWERMQAELDRRIKAAGARNAYFPLFIPESYLRKEAEHVEGFSPELAVVTHAGGRELEEAVVVRPTSETIINVFFSKWVQSHRDLPLLINQWANVVRWELRPRIFLRTTEFLWQEGHTAHATQADANTYALRILHEVYEDFARHVMALPVLVGRKTERERSPPRPPRAAPTPPPLPPPQGVSELSARHVMALPVLVGRKTERERFAGADATYTIEGMMGDGKALQMGTSHELGQNFAKAFGTVYLDDQGEQVHVWQTSWGASTRLIGALIMTHGDDAGLRLPPSLAPVQVVVVLVRNEEGAGERAAAMVAELKAAGHRVELDDRVDTSFGRRAVEWELKGVPVRVEVGPRDLAEGNVTVVRRDAGSKDTVPAAEVVARVAEALRAAQLNLLDEATRLRDERTVDVSSLDEAREAAQNGFARVPWSAVGEAGETELAGGGVTVRCLQAADGGLARTSSEPDLVAYVARAY